MFTEFPKIARLSRNCTITEKVDGTNSAITICGRNDTIHLLQPCVATVEDFLIYAQSRSRMITPEDDNYGFAHWVRENAKELVGLGPGTHFGEWWGQGIQRGYGLKEKRFSLFNTARWADVHSAGEFPVLPDKQQFAPKCCHVVPVLYDGPFETIWVEDAISTLRSYGSVAAPGFPKPEGVIVWHDAARTYFKKTLEKDNEWKSLK